MFSLSIWKTAFLIYQITTVHIYHLSLNFLFHSTNWINQILSDWFKVYSRIQRMDCHWQIPPSPLIAVLLFLFIFIYFYWGIANVQYCMFRVYSIVIHSFKGYILFIVLIKYWLYSHVALYILVAYLYFKYTGFTS